MKAAQIFFKFTVLILFVTVCLSACIAPDTQADDNTPANMILPYDDDGVFAFTFTSSNFESRDIILIYGEGRINSRYGGGTYYIGGNFCSYIADFVNIMNRLEPVLIDVISTDTSGFTRPFGVTHEPFEGFTHDNYLYWIRISDFDYYNFYMKVHKTEDFGYLHFSLSEWESLPDDDGFCRVAVRDGLYFHSLYRITLDELEQIIEFAEGLERGRVQVLVHLPPPPPPFPPPPPPYTVKEDESHLLTMLRNFFNVFSN